MKSNISQSRHGPLAKRRASTIIITVFLTILVCSFLVVLNLAHRSNAATSSASSASNTSSASSNTSHLTTPPLGVYFGSADGSLAKVNAANGQLVWRYATNGTTISAPTTVANGMVYVSAQNGTITALNATTGAVRWHFQTNEAIIASPTVANGVVYVGSSDGYLYALKASDGALIWHKHLGPANTAVSVGTASVSNGVVYDSSSDNVAHSYLFALKVSDGSQIWQSSVTNQLFTDPVVAHGVIFINSSALRQQGGPDVKDSYSYAFNAATGSLIWRSNTIGNYIPAPPTVANNVVYIGSLDTYVYALDAATGKQLWRHSEGGAIYNSPQVAGGVVFIGVLSTSTVNPVGSTTDTSSSESEIAAISASTGTLIWKHPIAQYEGTPLVVYQQVIYVGAGSNLVYALSTTSGAQVWLYTDSAAGALSNNAPITVAP